MKADATGAHDSPAGRQELQAMPLGSVVTMEFVVEWWATSGTSPPGSKGFQDGAPIIAVFD